MNAVNPQRVFSTKEVGRSRCSMLAASGRRGAYLRLMCVDGEGVRKVCFPLRLFFSRFFIPIFSEVVSQFIEVLFYF